MLLALGILISDTHVRISLEIWSQTYPVAVDNGRCTMAAASPRSHRSSPRVCMLEDTSRRWGAITFVSTLAHTCYHNSGDDGLRSDGRQSSLLPPSARPSTTSAKRAPAPGTASVYVLTSSGAPLLGNESTKRCSVASAASDASPAYTGMGSA